MPLMNLEEAYRRAVARRRQTRTDLATACVPFLVHSTFRARPRPAAGASLDETTHAAIPPPPTHPVK